MTDQKVAEFIAGYMNPAPTKTDDFLAHYGVKGMKWGVRRSPAQLARARGESPPKSRAKKKPKASLVSRKSPAPVKSVPQKKMSTAELQERVNRIRLEKQYAELTAPQKSAGRKFVEEVLSTSAKATATAYTTAGMKRGVKYALDKSIESYKKNKGKK